MVEAPKYGASSRTAAISAPSEPVPTTNTSSGSGGIPTCTIASVEPMPDPLRDADRKHVWHPFTQQLGWASEDAPIIERAEGTDLIDTDGRRYIDGVSSLWCNVHGHRHPEIDAAVRAQLDRVAHSTMLGLSHPAAIELAERLVGIAPPGPESRLLLGQRLDRHGDRAQDGVPVLAAAGRRQRAEDPLRVTPPRLPRRHRGVGVGRRHRPLPRDVPAAPVRLAEGRPRRRRRARVRAGRLPGRDRRSDRRAARPGSGRDGHAARRLPDRRPRALRPLRGAPDLRRGRHGLRPHGPDVRLRPRGHHAGPALHRQGAHGRLPAPRRHPRHRGDP